MIVVGLVLALAGFGPALGAVAYGSGAGWDRPQMLTASIGFVVGFTGLALIWAAQ